LLHCVPINVFAFAGLCVCVCVKQSQLAHHVCLEGHRDGDDPELRYYFAAAGNVENHRVRLCLLCPRAYMQVCMLGETMQLFVVVRLLGGPVQKFFREKENNILCMPCRTGNGRMTGQTMLGRPAAPRGSRGRQGRHLHAEFSAGARRFGTTSRLGVLLYCVA
jgi:hypothetical protein